MAQEQQDNQLQFLISDFNTRLNDLEERTKSIKERILLLGQNLLDVKEETTKNILEIEKTTFSMTSDLKKLKTHSENIVSEINNFARKDEMVLIERMLKNFQPLEFMRKKDVEELIDLKLKKQSSIKTKKTN